MTYFKRKLKHWGVSQQQAKAYSKT